ncbi:MAG TPA: PIG-L family deacetylase [Devosia sp.]|nr:PIG-L family deacetylase [Devosia sp.]
MGAASRAGLPVALAGFAGLLEDARAQGAGMMLVVAHPDDETIALGGHLPRLRQMPIACLTDGAPADLRDAHAHGFSSAADYADARRRELEAALGVAGYPRQHLILFGVPDQQAAAQLAPLARRLAALMTERRPRFVLTHAYEGGHPDHDAAAFVVAAAAELLRRSSLPAPTIVEMPFYHAGAGGTVYQRFIPVPDAVELVLRLSPDDAVIKGEMLACHASQSGTLAPFARDTERFRLAPAYDFRTLPNGGLLQYEAWQLGLTGADWLRLAADALAALELRQ